MSNKEVKIGEIGDLQIVLSESLGVCSLAIQDAVNAAAEKVGKEAVKKLWLTENSKDFKYLQYYEGLARMRGALIKKEYGTAFGIDEYAKRVIMEP